MILVLNGYPGVGKLAVGRELIERIDGRLLDIHSVYNVAFALAEPKSPEFVEAVEKVELIAHDLIRKLPAHQPVVLTTVLAGRSEWGDAEWQRILDLSNERPPLIVVHLDCSIEENIRRITSADRQQKRKPRDAAMAVRNQSERKPLYGLDAPHLLQLDITDLSQAKAADVIAEWVQSRRLWEHRT